jgi:putative ABC transport system substrate-binding protein
MASGVARPLRTIHCADMDRRALLTRFAALGSIATPIRVVAAPQRGTRRLAGLLFDGPDGWQFLVDELRSELARLGWTESKNLGVQWNYANNDLARLRSLATQIVAARPDVIVTRGTPGTRALQDATKTIPIATGVGDPVGSGFAKSYAEPGGNITGLSYAVVETSDKFVELLGLLVPGLAQLVVIRRADTGLSVPERMQPIETAARKSGIVVRAAPVANVDDVNEALRVDRRHGPSAALILGLGPEFPYEAIAAAALAAHMPTMFEYRDYVDGGGLASFRLNWENQTARAGAQLDKLLRGEKASKIPFELPTRQEFVLNLKTARALGIGVPRSVLLRADAVIE